MSAAPVPTTIPVASNSARAAAPLQYRTPGTGAGLVYSNGRTIAQRPYLAHQPKVWWQSLLIWPAIVIGAYIACRGILTKSDSELVEFLIFVVGYAAIMAFFFGQISLGYELCQMFDQGLRLETKYFTEWHNIHHYADTGREFIFFHKQSPAVEAGVAPYPPQPLLDELRRMLWLHEVPRDDRRSASFTMLRILIAVLAIVILVSGLYVAEAKLLPDWAVFWGFYWIDAIAIMLLERHRGLSRMTKIKAAQPEPKLMSPWATATSRPLSPAITIVENRDGRAGPIPPPRAEALTARVFYLAAYPNPPQPGSEWWCMLGDAAWEIVTIPSPADDGAKLLPVFTTPAALTAWIPQGAASVETSGALICQRITSPEGKTAGVVMNPAHPQPREVRRAQIQTMLSAADSEAST